MSLTNNPCCVLVFPPPFLTGERGRGDMSLCRKQLETYRTTEHGTVHRTVNQLS